MEVSIRNFGTIASADVHIGGLTVITGENDTGKSTVGKILFSLIKASARYEEDLEENKEANVTSIAERMYFTLRKYYDVGNHSAIRDLFHPRKLYTQFKLEGSSAVEERVHQLQKLMTEEVNMPLALYQSCIDKINKIAKIMAEPDTKTGSIERAINKAFFSEFRGEIIHKSARAGKSNAKVTISDGASELLDISWSRDKTSSFKYIDELGYNDATYVDSPSVIQFNELIKMSRTLFDADSAGRLTVPLHVKDLSVKLSDSLYGFDFFNNRESVSRQIYDLFEGVLSYNKNANDFLLERNGYNISSINTASGIKAISVLDLLLRGDNITRSSLLILDEPEVHLHPKWQIIYCEIICNLVSQGVDIIVTTHSPYIIEALKHFSDKSDLETRFYMAKKEFGSTQSEFIDVTNDVGQAIEKLAAPLFALNKDSFDGF